MKDHPSYWIRSRLACRDVVDRITDYLEERLPVRIKIRISLHAASCADCHAYMKQIALVSESIASLPARYPSPIHRLRLLQHFSALHSSAA